MNRTHTDHITLGRNASLTYHVLTAIHNRRVRDAANARRRAYVARITGFTGICNFALALRKKFA